MVLGTTVVACVASEHLSSTGQESVLLGPGSGYSFNVVPLGSGSATNPDPYFTLTSQTTNDDDYVTAIDLMPGCGPDFSIDYQPPLPGGSAEVYCMPAVNLVASGATNCIPQNYSFGASFHPTQTGGQSCQVRVTTFPKAGGSAEYVYLMLDGTGSGSAYSMSASPLMVNFGDVPLLGTSSPQLVTLTNTGSASITVTAGLINAMNFSTQPDVTVAPTYVLGSHAAAMFQVQCHADAAGGNYFGTLKFTTGATEGNLIQTVQLTCRGVSTSVGVNPSPVDLGTHLIGDTPTTVNVVITDTSTGGVTLSNFALNGTPGTEVTFAPNPGTITLSGMGSNATVSVKYAPTSERDYGQLGTMTFMAGTSSSNVVLDGGAHLGSIGTNPASIDFGAVCANGSATSQDLTIFANAGGNVVLTGPSGPGSPFSATLPGTPVSLVAHHGNEAKLTAKVTPLMSTPVGEHNDTINLQTNIPQDGMVPISIHATVLPGGVSPTPGLLHFGTDSVGTPSSVQTVTLTNCGTSDLTLTDATLTGSNADEFAIVSPADVHVTIPQTQSAAFLVLMDPKTYGVKTAQLVFSYAGGTSTVDLDGTGVGGVAPGGTKDRETYYACSTGTPTGFAPLAFAALLLRRRRRR